MVFDRFKQKCGNCDNDQGQQHQMHRYQRSKEVYHSCEFQCDRNHKVCGKKPKEKCGVSWRVALIVIIKIQRKRQRHGQQSII